MKVELSKITYDYTQGAVQDIQVGLSATDNAGQYINANVMITSADLADGKTFASLTSADIDTLAKSKLAVDTSISD